MHAPSPRFVGSGGSARRMWSSRSRSGGTGAGACIIRSCACWFIGKATTSRMLGVSASSMTMRSMPGAEPPCGGAPNLNGVEHAAEPRLDLGRRIARDRERLVHDVGPVVADRARRQFDAVADDVVLERLDRQRVLRLERLEPALRHRERVVGELDLPGLLVALVHREIDDPAELEPALAHQVQLARRASAAPRRRTARRRRGTPHTKNTASPSLEPELLRAIAPVRSAPILLAIGPAP